MDDSVEISGDLEALLAGIESGWETQMWYQRHAVRPDKLIIYTDHQLARLDPQPLEDLEADDEPAR